MSGYQQPGSGIDAGSGDIGGGFVCDSITEDFGESAALGAAGPYHSESAVVGAVPTVVSALCVVLGNGKLRWRRMMARYVDRQLRPECSAESWCAHRSGSRGCRVWMAFRPIRDGHMIPPFLAAPRHRAPVVTRTPDTTLWRVAPRAGPP